MQIHSRAPVRISFAGGGTDVSPYTEEHGGCIVSATINKYAWATVGKRADGKISLEDGAFGKKTLASKKDIRYGTKLDLLSSVVKELHRGSKGVDVTLNCDVPPRSGLGSSATAFVSLIGAFNSLFHSQQMTDYEVAEKAYYLERVVLKNKGGRQDQYASAFGGINYIEFKGDDFVRVNPVRIRKEKVWELEKNLVLAHVMDRSPSGDIITDQMKSYASGKRQVVDALHQVKSISQDINRALRKGDLELFGRLLHESWVQKKKFSPMISNKKIDKIYAAAKAAGAVGGKISGAGGGGHMILYCNPGRERKVAQAVEKKGAVVRSFSFDMEGLVSWEV